MAVLKPNSLLVYNYVKDHDGEKFTSADIADALGLTKKSVDGIVTSAFQRKGLMVRTPAEIELADGTHKKVSFISLTEAGKNFVPEVE